MNVQEHAQHIRGADNDWEMAHSYEDTMMHTALLTIAAGMAPDPQALAAEVVAALKEFEDDPRWYA